MIRTAALGRFALVLGVLALPACAPSTLRPRGTVPAGTPQAVDLARARASPGAPGFPWSPWSDETFARARRERKFLLVDGAAAWCHWCHVMDETTYRDPEVARVLRERFVAIKVDIDERPDIGERYAAWGWPATVILTPDAEELGKYRGYLPPDQLREILSRVDASRPLPEGDASDETPAPAEALSWLAVRVRRDLDAYYDAEEGGWGLRQKAPLGENVEALLLRARSGDPEARAHAAFTLRKQRALIDPVWSGIYQYSAGRRWDEPHFEKLMTMQVAAIEAYARGAQVLGDASFLADARGIAGYVERFLTDPRGAFLPSQDADVNAHEPGLPFIDGHVFYAENDAGRRALGVPRVDPHAYPHENGIAIAAFVTLHEVTNDPAPLAAARRAAEVMLRENVDAEGRVKRGEKGEVRYLADAAWLGRGLARLAEATAEPRYGAAAIAIAKRLETDFGNGKGALLAHTVDPAAAGVFARRASVLTHTVGAARFLAALARVTGDGSHREHGKRLLAFASTPAALDAQGRWLGGYLLALAELSAGG